MKTARLFALLCGSIGLSVGAANATQAPTAEQVAAARRTITDDPAVPSFAPKGYDVTIVEYSDYQCPFCRRSQSVLAALLASDGKIRVVYRDWPVLGEASTLAARLAMAAKYQGRYIAFHDALLQTSGRLDDQAIRAAAARARVDWQRLQQDLKTYGAEIDALLDRTRRQAAAMNLRGTPGFLIGPYLVPGALDLATFKKVVALARANPTGDPGKGR
ncbi:DsbA family protein [uncultured Sphingomonas sp.]|uniref:DsbA family protein n=1 Tax=uncultured Sphingomonas sp. TaxID=158754 RepID=UPI002637E071|nr:DsbA family protein [uncultured Sphingomonas sp.]